MRSVALAGALFALSACPAGDPAGPDLGSDTSRPPDAASDVRVTLPLTGRELAEACARTSACGIKAYPVLANCVDAYFNLHRPQGVGPLYDRIYRCVNAAAGDCAAMAQCLGGRGACESGYKATCEGDVAVSCDLLDNQVYAFDCAAADMSCAIKSGQTAMASCTPEACDGSFTSRCEGDRLLTCGAGVIEVEDCLAEGKFCVEGKMGPYCRGNRRQSCVAMQSHCLNNVAVSCEQGHEHWTDCDQLEAFSSLCQAGECVPAGTQCDHEMNRCAGDSLEACLDGSWQTIDCAQLGLGPCKPEQGWANCSAQ